MRASQLLLVKPGFLTEEYRAKLERKGLVVIETSDFEAFKLMHTDFVVAGDDFAIAALEVITEGYSSEKFAKKILAIMKERRK